MILALSPLPPGQARCLRQHLALVCAVAAVIALVRWAGTGMRLDVALVYSAAISLLTWALIDPPRLLLRRLLRTQAPSYWPPRGRAAMLLAVAVPSGYVLGTCLGDAYAGQSTWQLLHTQPGAFVGLLAFSLAISLGFSAYFLQQGRAQALARQAQETRLRLLQAQLDPHMLFNTLAHVRALMNSDPALAVTMIDHLDDYLRKGLDASRQHQQSLAREMARLEDYLALMQIRMGARLSHRLQLPPELAWQPVPSLLLQPLVENAIVHGLEPSVQGGCVSVRAWARAGRLHIEVCDDGVGAGDAAQDTSGYGLSHVRERLATLWGAAARVDLWHPPEGGTCVRLSWPLATEETMDVPGPDR